jgi:hypothetical protein
MLIVLMIVNMRLMTVCMSVPMIMVVVTVCMIMAVTMVVCMIMAVSMVVVMIVVVIVVVIMAVFVFSGYQDFRPLFIIATSASSAHK